MRSKPTVAPVETTPPTIVDANTRRSWVHGAVTVLAATGAGIGGLVAFFTIGDPGNVANAAAGRVFWLPVRHGALYVTGYGLAASVVVLVSFLILSLSWEIWFRPTRRAWAAIKRGLKRAAADLANPRRRSARSSLGS